MEQIALVVGRFQPLHIGHLNLFEYCEKNYADVTVILGKSPDGRTARNPLTVAERRQLVKTVNPSFTVTFATENFSGEFEQNVIDALEQPPSNYTLVTHNQNTIDELSPTFTITKPPISIICRGTEIRKNILEGKEWNEYIDNTVYQLLKKFNFEDKVKQTATEED